MNRRGFLGAILAAGAAPAIIRAESLMKLASPCGFVLRGGIFVPTDLAGAIRERRAFDPHSDEEIIRYDVVYRANGELRAMHVDVRDDSGAEPAIRLLADGIRAERGIPVSGSSRFQISRFDGAARFL